MLRISTYDKLSDYINDQGFKRVRGYTLDDSQVLNILAKDPSELAGGLADWLKRFNGVYVLKFKQNDTSPVDFTVKWEPDQQGAASLLQGGPADAASIKAQVLAELKAEAEREAEREELERLKTINGQFTTALGAILPGVLDMLQKRFMPGMSAANLQGITVDDLPQHEQDVTTVAVNRLLQHVSPAFMNSLANYVDHNPAIIPTVAAMIGHQEPEPQPEPENQ